MAFAHGTQWCRDHLRVLIEPATWLHAENPPLATTYHQQVRSPVPPPRSLQADTMASENSSISGIPQAESEQGACSTARQPTEVTQKMSHALFQVGVGGVPPGVTAAHARIARNADKQTVPYLWRHV